MEEFMDKRKEFIFNMSGNYFGKCLDEFQNEIMKNEKVDNFLNDAECLVLGIDFTGTDPLIVHQISRFDHFKNTLVFYKIIPTRITDENISVVLRICSLGNPPLDSFYYLLQNVYTSAVLQDVGDPSDIKLQTLFQNMEAGLKTALVKKNSTLHNDPNHDSLSGILTLSDECDYWIYIKLNSENPKERLNAQKVLQILKPLESKLSEINYLAGLEELLEDAYNAFDDIWKLEKFSFSETRMTNLFELIGNAVCQIIQNQLKNTNIWTESFHEINDFLLSCLEICNKWIDTCRQLTSIFWPNYSSHCWIGGVHKPGYIQKFVNRLNQILEMRNVHHNITQLLSKKERQELKIVDNFAAFSGINVVLYNPYTENVWKSALNAFNRNLKSVEEYVTKKIKEKLLSCSTNVLQLFELFKRYRDIIQKEEIRDMLKGERQNFLTLLHDYVNNELQPLEIFSHDALIKKFPSELIDLPEIVLKISWIKEILNKVIDIEKTAKMVLHDLHNYDHLQDSIISLKKELQANDSSCFNEWCTETLLSISTSNLSLKTEDPVVYFEHGERMVVNYNSQLIVLIKEVHHLSLLEYKIPSSITDVTDKAKIFVKQAKALEQVAGFHNTIGDRMIPSQRPMMLSLAVELSSLVRSENSVKWSDHQAVDQYISRLQLVVNRLALENNRLYFYHSQILQKATDLIDADLLQQKIKWRDVIREIWDVITEVNRKFTNTKTWAIHWDYQIYKILQCRYQIGLLNLNECLPEMKVELVYRQQKLQFNPPLEEIKLRYYNQLKRFITLPLTFQGVSDICSSIFSTMVSRNADHFKQVYVNAEKVFNRLLMLRDEWVDKVALGSVDLEGAVKDHIKSADDWDLNFRISKAWGQEIAKIVNYEHKIDCFLVSIAPVRSEIELHNNRYWDVLSISLYASILLDVNMVEEFITDAKKSLDYQPQSFEEIGNAKEYYRNMIEKAKEISNIVEEMDKKNQILSSWMKERVNQVSIMKQEWNNFQTLLDNQQFYIDRQVESIKSKLMTEAENLSSELEKFILRWERSRPKETDLVVGDYAVINQNIGILKEKREEWIKLSENLKKIKEDYARFEITLPESLNYEQTEKELRECEKTWGIYEQFIQGLEELNSEDWIMFRSKGVSKFESFVSMWRERLEKMDVTPLTAKLLSDLHKYEDFIPSMKFLRGDAFNNKHWSELCAILKIPPKCADKLTFGDFLKARDLVLVNLGHIQELNSRAASEVIVRQALAELDIWEVESRFSFMSHFDSKGREISLIKDFKGILSSVGDNQCLLQSMIGSPNYEQYRNAICMWETKLIDLDYYLRNLSEIQRKWLYLEPIFKNETMKIETGRFERIDKDFRYVCGCIQGGDRKVAGLCRIPNLRNIVGTLVQQLNICQKSLNEYLEEKRLTFPKFYFLSDDDLLEILGQANKPEVVQSHLKKLFAGINSVLFDKNNILAVRSIHGETVSLRRPVTISLDVENWLNNLSDAVRETLKELLTACLKNADPLAFPSQILCLAESISFTCRCEESIKTGKLTSLLSSLEKQLETYTKLNLDLEDEDCSVLELKLKALIFDTIYHIDIVKDLLGNSVSSIDDWNWQKRIRLYLQDNAAVLIKMVDAEFNYTYEYQGNSAKLVHTPLTDRCYLTLTQAMSMGLGGNPYGPAGTGKTESVKALGRLFGRQVLVFNCDEGLDIQSLTRILIGLVKCGAWGCFDEFNRLEEATLSAVSTCIHIIQDALRNNVKIINLMNRQIELNFDTGIFVTMNPAGRGYGGRQKLPDNLKQLFRPIAMSIPDDLQIAEVILYSEGFKNAKVLARKLVEIFDIAKKVLSSQKHYDWGLRALKTVIGGCKTALKAAKTSPKGKLDETTIVVQAIRLNTLSKLTFSDAHHFDQLINDTFQSAELNTQRNTEMESAVKDSFTHLNLQFNAKQVRKCLELYEQLEQRMGVVIVGPSGSGKTTICMLLKQALISRTRIINQYIINPKSMPRTQLLGKINEDTRQWIDGVLSSIAQKIYNEPPNVESWIIFDGDIDPEWIESLNSVLDDNRLLTLPSGWRIHFGPNIHFLFETNNLQHASPATVSRMGIILLSEEDVDIKCIVESWLEKQADDSRYALNDFIEKYFYRGCNF